MIPQPVWRPSYERGLAHLQAGDVDEALKAFDEVYELSGRKLRPFRSRSEVLGTLQTLETADAGRHSEAKSAEVPDARLFDALARLSPELQGVVLGPSVGHARGCRIPLTCLPLVVAQSIFTSAVTAQDLTVHLPPEVLTLIGRHLVEITGSSVVAFTLVNVCRRWRNIFMRPNPAVWGRLRLQDRHGCTQQERAQTLALIARGPPRGLELVSSTSYDVADYLEKLRGRTSQLSSLVLSLPREEHISLVSQGSENLASRMILPWLKATLHSIVVGLPVSSAQSLAAVKYLEINENYPSNPEPKHEGLYISLGDHLDLFPALETLFVNHRGCSLFPTRSGPDPIVGLPTLRKLILEAYKPAKWDMLASVHIPSAVFLLPALEVLDLSGSVTQSYIPYLFPESHPPNTQHLTHLVLRGSLVDAPTLSDHLLLFPALVHLDVRKTVCGEALLRALVQPAKGDAGAKLCCKLEELHIESEQRREGEEEQGDDTTAGGVDLREVAREMIESRAGHGTRKKTCVKGWSDHGSKLAWEV